MELCSRGCSQNYVECGPLLDIALHAGRIVSHADASQQLGCDGCQRNSSSRERGQRGCQVAACVSVYYSMYGVGVCGMSMHGNIYCEGARGCSLLCSVRGLGQLSRSKRLAQHDLDRARSRTRARGTARCAITGPPPRRQLHR